MLNRLITIPLFAFTLGVIFEYLFFGQALGVNYPIWIGIFIIGLGFFFSERFAVTDRRSRLFFGGSLFFAIMVCVRESDLLTVLNILASLGLLALGIESLAGKPMRRYSVLEYIATAFLPIKCLPYFFVGMEELATLGTSEENRSKIARVLKGSLIALPIIGVLIFLFSSADLVFRKYVTELISFDFSAVTIAYFLRVGFVTAAAFSMYTYIARSMVKPESVATDSPKASGTGLGSIETGIVLGSVATVFFVFLVIQFTYLFGREGAIAAQGFLYSEYARRGFFELIAVSLIAFFLLLATARQVVRNGTRHAPIFRWLAGILIFETVLVMVSAYQRLSLYELAYGFTTLRLYSHLFILWISMVFLFLAYEIYIREDRTAFAFRWIVSMILFLLVVNVLNPDQFIARENIKRYHATGDIDFNYLMTLSTDAFPETVKLLDDAGIKERIISRTVGEMPTEDRFLADYRNLLSAYRWRYQLRVGTSSAEWPEMHLARERWRAIYEARKVEIESVVTQLKNVDSESRT